MKKLSVIVPVYMNDDSLLPLFEELGKVEQSLSERDMQMELIFVDDGSTDGSYATLIEIKKKRPATKLIKLTRNFGAIHASKTGYQHATGDCITGIAADLQDPPSLILEMVDKWRQGAKYVVCARKERQDPFLTKFFAAIYYQLIRIFVVPDYPKHGYDLCLMDQSVLPHIQKSGKNINTPLFTYWLGFKPEFVYYSRQKREHGKSRWTFAKKAKLFLDSLLGFSIVPIRTISALGFFISLASFGYGIFIVINAFLGRTVIQGFATIVTLISFLLGLVIVMLGIIGEYLWRIFDETNKRPEAVIEEIR